jgi:hypothetical protein
MEQLISLATIRGLVDTSHLRKTTSDTYVYRLSTLADTQRLTMAQNARKIVVAVDFGQ